MRKYNWLAVFGFVMWGTITSAEAQYLSADSMASVTELSLIHI